MNMYRVHRMDVVSNGKKVVETYDRHAYYTSLEKAKDHARMWMEDFPEIAQKYRIWKAAPSCVFATPKNDFGTYKDTFVGIDTYEECEGRLLMGATIHMGEVYEGQIADYELQPVSEWDK